MSFKSFLLAIVIFCGLAAPGWSDNILTDWFSPIQNIITMLAQAATVQVSPNGLPSSNAIPLIAQAQHGAVFLDWSQYWVESSTTFNRYIVYRSMNQRDWQEVGSTHYFSFLDQNAPADIPLYYRVVAQYDDHRSTSDAVSVVLESQVTVPFYSRIAVETSPTTSAKIAKSIEVTYDFPLPTYHVGTDGYTAVSVEGLSALGSPGEPLLPYRAAHILIPTGYQVHSIEYYPDSTSKVDSVVLPPAQPDLPLLVGQPPAYIPPDPVAYSAQMSNGLVQSDTVQFSSGFQVLPLKITPVAYTPALKQLAFSTRIRVRVNLEADTHLRKQSIQALFPKQLAAADAKLGTLVDNKALLDSQIVLSKKAISTLALPIGIDMLIIAPQTFESGYQPLINYKNLIGIKTKFISVEQVLASTTGVDDAEKIKNFIRSYYTYYGIQYVILGADVEWVPTRKMISYCPNNGLPDDANINSDVYFGCLDDNWDPNGNGIYCEQGENFDRLAEVAVGRFPASSVAEVINMVNKELLFCSQDSRQEFVRRIDVYGENLDATTNGSLFTDYISPVFPSGNVLTPYAFDRTPWTKQTVLNNINADSAQVIVHMGHSSQVENAMLYSSDLTGLANTKPYLWVTGGCFPNYFVYSDSIAEKHLTSPKGAVAFVGNSHYGWYTTGRGNGKSAQYMFQFFKALMRDGIDPVGRALLTSREWGTSFWDSSNGFNTYKLLFFAINLLGDPSLQLVPYSPSASVGSGATIPAGSLLVDRLIAEGRLTSTNYPMLTATSNYRGAATQLWQGYKKTFIEDYRALIPLYASLVFDPKSAAPDNQQNLQDQSSSQSNAYGLLLALFADDQMTFDSIIAKMYTSGMYKSTTSKLFCSKVGITGILDLRSNTNADQDIALALVFADMLKRSGSGGWSGSLQDYAGKAQQLIDAIYLNNFEYYRYIKLGDDYGTGRSITNLSYFSPAYYRIFSQYETTNHDWQYIIDQGYRVLAQQQGAPLGIAPDWCDGFGTDAYYRNQPDHSWAVYQQGQEAIRLYWKLALDAIWYTEPRAKAFLANTPKIFAPPYNISPNVVNEIGMTGYPVFTTHNYSDIGYAGMFTAGAAGLSDVPATLPYRQTWKRVYESYLADAYQGPNSFLSKYYPDDKYNNTHQSLGLLSTLLISGALPNIYAQFVRNGGLSIGPLSIPTNVYNKTKFSLAYTITGEGGPGAISTINIELAKGNSMCAVKCPARFSRQMCNVISDPDQVVQLASFEKEYSGNSLHITFNMCVSANWTTGSVQYSIIAYDQRGQSAVRLGADRSQFFNYADHSVVLSQAGVVFPAIITPTRDQIICMPTPILFASSDPTSSLLGYTDNDPATPGQSGLVLRNKSGQIVDMITINVILRDQWVTPSNTDSAWRPVCDFQDFADKRFLVNVTPLPSTSRYLFVKANFSKAYPGLYTTNLHLKLQDQSNTNKISDFDEQTLQTQWGSAWSLVTPSLLADTTATLTLATANAFGEGTSLRLQYALGMPSQQIAPQVMLRFALNPNEIASDISAQYSGITFLMKSSTPNPIAVVLESSDITDFDYFLMPIVSPSGEWVKYSYYFRDFKKTGFGQNTRTITDALKSVKSIQFKTLSEHPGESGDIYFDDIYFLP